VDELVDTCRHGSSRSAWRVTGSSSRRSSANIAITHPCIGRALRASGVSQDSVHRFLAGAPVHPATRAKLEQALERLELKASDRGPGEPCPASGW